MNNIELMIAVLGFAQLPLIMVAIHHSFKTRSLLFSLDEIVLEILKERDRASKEFRL